MTWMFDFFHILTLSIKYARLLLWPDKAADRSSPK